MPFTFLQILKKFLCHGQTLCVYPGAFDDEEITDEEYAVVIPFGAQSVELTTSDRVSLRCLLIPARTGEHRGSGSKTRARPTSTVIVFHGNGCHLWHHVPCGMAFARLGCNVFMVSYRGYGKSGGKPSEKGLIRDAQAALDYVLSHPELSKTRIFLHGHSLGGAVAIALAHNNPSKISALIVENTFLSIPEVAKEMPLVRHFTWVIHQRWNSAERVSRIPRSLPIVMISGSRDEVVPASHMVGLWEIAQKRGLSEDPEVRAKGAPDILNDELVTFPDGSHADTWCQPNYWSKIKQILNSLELLPSSKSPSLQGSTHIATPSLPGHS